MTRGRYIAFEGLEGCGKSTHVTRLAEAIGGITTREPGGTAIGGALRAAMLDTNIAHATSSNEAKHFYRVHAVRHTTVLRKPQIDELIAIFIREHICQETRQSFVGIERCISIRFQFRKTEDVCSVLNRHFQRRQIPVPFFEVSIIFKGGYSCALVPGYCTCQNAPYFYESGIQGLPG